MGEGFGPLPFFQVKADMPTYWENLKYPTDGPFPKDHIRVAGCRIPIRICMVGGTVIPIPWTPETEKRFREWFRGFALAKGWSTNPDHDKYDTDWRTAYFMGFRDIQRDETLKTTSGLMPAQKIGVLRRTANTIVVARG